MRIYYYLVIIVGLMALFSVAGIETPTSYALDTLGIMNIENIQSTTFFTSIVAVFLAVAGAGILIGVLTRTAPESYLLGSLMASVLVLFVGDLVSIIAAVRSYGVDWITYIILLLAAPLIVGYLISLVEFWRGTD